jgi:uncharacterized protein
MKFKLMNSKENLLIIGNEVVINAGKETNYFIDISSGYKKTNAPFYYTYIEDDFTIRSKISPEFLNDCDAGCLLIYESDEKWIKLAFEKTNFGCTSIVSVVTDGKSDDSNGERINQEAVWLQIMRKGHNWALHYSIDESEWYMVRLFQLEFAKGLKIGISAQSPCGNHCKVKFQKPQISTSTFKDMRNMKE